MENKYIFIYFLKRIAIHCACVRFVEKPMSIYCLCVYVWVARMQRVVFLPRDCRIVFGAVFTFQLLDVNWAKSFDEFPILFSSLVPKCHVDDVERVRAHYPSHRRCVAISFGPVSWVRPTPPTSAHKIGGERHDEPE